MSCCFFEVGFILQHCTGSRWFYYISSICNCKLCPSDNMGIISIRYERSSDAQLAPYWESHLAFRLISLLWLGPKLLDWVYHTLDSRISEVHPAPVGHTLYNTNTPKHLQVLILHVHLLISLTDWLRSVFSLWLLCFINCILYRN